MYPLVQQPIGILSWPARGGMGGENMCEDLRSGSGNTGMCIPSARSSVTFLTSVLTAYCIKGTCIWVWPPHAKT